MALAALLAVVPAAVIGVRLIDVNTETVEELSQDLQLALLDDISRTIARELSDAQDGLHAVGRVLTDESIPGDQAIPLALALVEAAEPLDHAAVYSAEGELIDVIRQDTAPNLDVPETLAEPLRREAARANVATGEAEVRAGSPRVPIVVPLRARGQVTGFVTTLLSLEVIQRRVERLSQTRFGERGGSLFVVDRRLRLLAHPDRELAKSLASAPDQGILRQMSGDELRRELIRSGELEAADGTPMVASSMAVPGRPWVVVAQVPQSVAYASLNRMRLEVISTVVAAMVAALLLGLWVSRRITAPLARLTGFARALAERRFDATVEVETRDELAVLAESMRGAARDLAESEDQLRREAAVRADLGRYLPAELVDKVVRREHDLALGGERRVVTVLFADVVSFTPLTEQRAPEEVVTILNELFTILTGIVFRHGGMVDKFVGDCVMALWGAHQDQPDHAARGLDAAEDMMHWLETGNVAWRERFGVTIQLAIGVHTGEAVVGNIGSETRMEYTAIGDAVNVAARLEAIARPQQILTTAATREAAGEGFDITEAGSHQVPGRREPLELYEVRS